MIWFWTIAALMLLAALLFVLPPLLGRGAAKPASAATELDVETHRERLLELERARASETLSEEDFEAARAELARALLHELESAPVAPEDASPKRSVWAAALIGIGLPVACIGLYVGLGSSESLSPAPAASGPAASAVPETQASVEQMVTGLAARLQTEPDDPEGWLMLARSYVVLERYPLAVEAYARAHDLIGDAPQLLVDYAEALALANANQLSGRPSELLDLALERAPGHQKGLWLAGFAALQIGDVSSALTRWERLLGLIPGDSEQARMVREMIATAGGVVGDLPTQEAKPAADPVAGKTVEVHVSLDPSLAERVSGDETLFIFARAVQGPPMPLAISRHLARELPLKLTLDDSMGMMPSLKLSSFEAVTVGARISRSGNATAQSGDLEGFVTPVTTTDGTVVTLTIDRTVP